MLDMLRRVWSDRASQLVLWGIGAGYLLLFQLALGDLAVDGTVRPLSLTVADRWQDLVLRPKNAFQFEAVARLELPFVVWLLSPVNIAVGLALGLLVGLQIALVRITRHCAVRCGVSSLPAVLAAFPGLLAGGACCAPVLLVLLGITATASLISVLQLLLPIAFALLLAGALYTLNAAAKRCEKAEARTA